MYSGSTLTKISGAILGAHQKIDRIARKQLEQLLPGVKFPEINDILKFEGTDGPDGIKRKSPAHNEPWHMINPFDKNDHELIDHLTNHYNQLVKALRGDDEIKSAFEAAWLAHTIVDGLTPAHHFPYEEALEGLGAKKDEMDTIAKKVIIPGETTKRTILNGWKVLGPKGFFTTHYTFEWGFATLIAPLSFADKLLPKKLIERLKAENLANWFRELAQSVASMNIYDDFIKHGWNLKMTRAVKNELAPSLIDAVTAVWYCAAKEAKEKH